jgi:hypothetical protein
MKYIIKETLDSYLRQNGTYEEYYEEVREIGEELFSGLSNTKLMISEVIDLAVIKKYIKVDILAVKGHNLWGCPIITFKIETAAELTTDEYIELATQNDPILEDSYDEMVKMIG